MTSFLPTEVVARLRPLVTKGAPQGHTLPVNHHHIPSTRGSPPMTWSISCPSLPPTEAKVHLEKALADSGVCADESEQDIKVKAVSLAQSVIDAQKGDVKVGVTCYGSLSKRADGSVANTLSVAISATTGAPPAI
jgi:hypothetical protein